jgi:hypothetical protein
MSDDETLTDETAEALSIRIGFAVLDLGLDAEVSRILNGYRDAIRAPLLAQVAALEKERNALREYWMTKGKRDA